MEPLDELTARLESLVTLLGGEAPPSGHVLDSAFASTTAAFERLREVTEGLEDHSTSEEVLRRIEGVLRLDAVAVGLASRHRDGLGLELDKVSGAREHIRSLNAARRDAGTGDSCDMTG